MSFDPSTTLHTNKPLHRSETPAFDSSLHQHDIHHGDSHTQLSTPASTSTSSVAPAASAAPCPIHDLSVELLARIFARLDPVSLAVAAATCHYWRRVIMDDMCWKNALMAFFGQLPYRRLRPDTWKSEYILRTHLLRKWAKGRGALMTLNPKIGSIDCSMVDFRDSSMMVASLGQGTAVQGNPSTGKLERHRFYGWEEGMPCPVNAIKMDSHRIFWGLTTGYVTMTIRGKNLHRHQLKSFSSFHQGPVQVLCAPRFAADILLSGGQDGAIKVWHVPSHSELMEVFGSTSETTTLDATVDHHVVAGFANGTVVVWDMYLNKLQQQVNDENQEEKGDFGRRLIHAPKMNQITPVHSVHYQQGKLLVTYNGLPTVFVYDITTCACVITFGDKIHTLGATISATAVDMDVRRSFTDHTLLDSPTVFDKKPKRVKKANATATSTLEENFGENLAIGPDIAMSGSPSSSSSTSSSSVHGTRKHQHGHSQLHQHHHRHHHHHHHHHQHQPMVYATGDTSGNVALWSIAQVLAKEEEDASSIAPIQVLPGVAEAAAISVIQVDAFKVVTGADDGWIRFFDPLSGEFLHAIGNKIPKHAPVDRSDMSIMRVKSIACDEYRGVATVGHNIKTWDFSSRFVTDRRPRTGKKAAPAAAMRDQLMHYEIKQEMVGLKEELDEERRQRERDARKRSEWTMHDMSEEEMVAYALMLSQEGENVFQTENDVPTAAAMAATPSPSPSPLPIDPNYNEDDALMRAVMASLEMHDDLPAVATRIDDLDHWPAIGQPGDSHDDDDDDDDEELQRILKLSEIDK
ncbi:WD40-repeat-containing domain protein [Gongronella butleri]|nr:WD40-repeat-containing domain protein [Gongronella butleri]